MTNDERDLMIRETHDAVLVMSSMVRSHNDDIYGNGKAGIKMDVDRLKVFRTISCWFYIAFGTASISVMAKLVYNVIAGAA